MDLPCHSSSSLSLCFPILPSLLSLFFSLSIPAFSFHATCFFSATVVSPEDVHVSFFFYCFLLSPNTFLFVCFQMFNAIKQGVVHSLQQPPPDIEALRVYLLLPEFSIYQKEEQYDAIVIPFGEAILRLSVDAGKVLSEYEEPCEKKKGTEKNTVFYREGKTG